MAEIHIEKKNKPVWPWVLAILVVIAIVWVVIDARSDKKRETAYNNYIENDKPFTKHPVENYKNKDRNNTSSEATPQAPTAEKTREFVYFVNDKDIQNKLGVDQQATSEGLMMLSGALQDLSQGSNSYSQYIDRIKKDAQRIEKNPESLKNANMVRLAFKDAAVAMDKIQKDKFPNANAEVAKVKNAAKKIEPDQELLQQKDDVNAFFQDAAQAVNKMEQEIFG